MTILALLGSLYAEDGPPQIPDPIPVAMETQNVYIEGSIVLGTKTTHDTMLIPKADWTKKYGPLTENDRLEWLRFGCIRRSQVIHHVTL